MSILMFIFLVWGEPVVVVYSTELLMELFDFFFPTEADCPLELLL